MNIGVLNGGGKSTPKPSYRAGNITPATTADLNRSIGNAGIPSTSPLKFAQVKDVCTSLDHPLYKILGTKGLGAVILQSESSNLFLTDNNEIDYSNLNYDIAFPLFPNIKNYPLKGEIVIILSGPDFTSQFSPDEPSRYYICSINMWNNSHNNVLYSSNGDEENQSITTNPSYFNNIPPNAGSTDTGNNTELGKFFKENEYIKILLPYEGDVIYEGRFGNSIRLSSTNKDTNTNNNWSEAGDDGDPLTIIRVKRFTAEDSLVGLGETPPTPEETPPTLEDINNDDSSIWITSTQKIPIDINFL